MKVIIGILIPFIGTIIGASLVFFMKKELNKKVEIIIYGFAAGVMMAALIWSLIIPAIESSSVIPVIIGLVLGVGTFYLIFSWWIKFSCSLCIVYWNSYSKFS